MRFIDSVQVEVRAGDGGRGMLSFKGQGRGHSGRADGGDGGDGGNVILFGDERMNTLLEFRFKPLHKALSGTNGGTNGKTGGRADAMRLPVPLGTIVSAVDPETAEREIVGEILSEGAELCVARGGVGGKGNMRFTKPNRPLPDFVLPPTEGEHCVLRLELKLMADVGLLGMPNAGKSTLIRAVSKAKPEVADYPFTTKVPSLGIARSGSTTMVIADIPGLIEGAAEGAGLGHQFLRHVERVRVLAHLVTLAAHETDEGVEGLVERLAIIERELAAYSAELAARPRIVVLSQIDQPWVAELIEPFRAWCHAQGHTLVCTSGHRGDGCAEFLRALAERLPERVAEGKPAQDFDPAQTL
jgi:GTPase